MNRTVERFVRNLREVGGEAREVADLEAVPGAVAELLGNGAFGRESANPAVERAAVAGLFEEGPDDGQAVAESSSLLYVPTDWARNAGLEDALRESGLAPVDAGAGKERLGRVPLGLTDGVLAVAETGTILIGGPRGPWGAAAVLPPIHAILLRPADVVDDLDEAFVELVARMHRGERDWLWITGPSRTADIAKTLVRGVHGPHRLVVLLVETQSG